MRQATEEYVIAVQPEDIVRFLEGEPLAIALGDVLETTNVEFRPTVSSGPTLDDTDLTPVLGASAVRRLAEAGAVLWDIDDTVFAMHIERGKTRNDAAKRLKEAFGAHGKEAASTSEDPCYVWQKFKDTRES